MIKKEKKANMKKRKNRCDIIRGRGKTEGSSKETEKKKK